MLIRPGFAGHHSSRPPIRGSERAPEEGSEPYLWRRARVPISPRSGHVKSASTHSSGGTLRPARGRRSPGFGWLRGRGSDGRDIASTYAQGSVVEGWPPRRIREISACLISHRVAGVRPRRTVSGAAAAPPPSYRGAPGSPPRVGPRRCSGPRSSGPRLRAPLPRCGRRFARGRT